MTEENTISFHVSEVGEPILELRENGDIFLHGKQVGKSIDVVTGMREFLAKSKEQETAQGQYKEPYLMTNCIGCGYCCRKVPCPQAYHNHVVENGRCTALMWHEGRWACGLYVTAPNEEEKARIAKELYFGAGCCSNLNTYRRYNYIPTKKELEDETILLRVIEGNQ